MSPTTFDLLALGAIVASVILSALRGLVGEIVAFVGWVIALIVARMFAVPVSDVVFASMNPRPLAVVCAFVLVYVVARLGVVVIQQVLEFVLDKAHLSKLNRALGAFLGAIKGVIVVSLVVLACSFSDLPQKAAWQNAITAPFFETLAMQAKPYLPDFLAEQVAFRHDGASDNAILPNVGDEKTKPLSSGLKTKKK